VSLTEFKQGFVFKPKPDADIALIVGSSLDDKHASLVLMRFHNVEHKMTHTQQKDLLKKLLKVAGKKGFDGNRKGGSTGLTRYDIVLIHFLKLNPVFPRHSKAVKLVRKGTCWECIYLSPYQPTAEQKDAWNKKQPFLPLTCEHPYRPVTWSYAPPVQGGSFEIPSDLPLEYPFLLDFAEFKLRGAFLLISMHAKGTLKYSVSPVAVQREIQHYIIADWGDKTGTLEMDPKYKGRRQIILYQMICFNKHTIVLHSVGYHCDVFQGGDSLENKICFIDWSRTNSCGRGGAGGNFVWALLDWSNSYEGVRRRVYLANGGQEPIVDLRVWRGWLTDNGNHRLREIVNRRPQLRGNNDLFPGDLNQLSQEL
jgi:hypothetical protein